MGKIFSLVPVMKKVVPVLFISAVLLPLPARAEIKAGSIELSPFAGYSFFQDRQNLENRPIYGGRLGANFTRYVGMEISGEVVETRVKDKSKAFTREGQFTTPVDRETIIAYHLDLLYHVLPDGPVNPYLIAGYGVNHYSPKINNKSMSVVNFGVGAKFWLANNIALRLDLRDKLILDEQIHNPEATLGVVFAFGGETKAVAAPEPKSEPKTVIRVEPAPPAPPQAKAKIEEKVIILASEPTAVEKVQVAAAQPKLIILAFEDIHFDFDQSTLKPEAQAILKRNIKVLQENPQAQIRIAGYTSASGTDEYNQKLSERRANAVKAYLVSEGVIMEERLATVGYGESNPASFEAAPSELYSPAAKANMRVLFEIVVK